MDETVNPASVRQWPGAHRTACRAAYAAVAVAGDDGPVMRLLSRWRGGQSRPVRSEVNMGGRGGRSSGFALAPALLWFTQSRGASGLTRSWDEKADLRPVAA